MLRLLPIASSFHSAEQVQRTVAALAARLQAHPVPHAFLAAGEGTPDALLILTGGTEHLALEALASLTGPALLVAHPHQNSLPASLEILSRLRQIGRPGRILLLNDQPESLESLAEVAQLLEARKRLAALRLGRIGAPSDWLVGSMPEPGRVQQVWGPTVVDVPLSDLQQAIPSADPGAVEAFQRPFTTGADAIGEPTPGELAMASRVGVALRKVVQEHALDACTVRCFDLVKDLQTTGCLALSALLDEGVVAGCEGDLPAALTMAWMQAVTGETSFMANPQDLDPASNTLWLAHCTIARGLLQDFALRSHFESSLGVGIQGRMAPGPITLARIGGLDLRELFVSDGELLANGDSELRCRTQIQLRLEADVRELLTHPLGNHLVLIRGHWAQRLQAYHRLFVQ